MINHSHSVVTAAKSFSLTAGPVGLLIIHGYGGSIADYRDFADRLHQIGYTVMGVRLAGHGQGVEALAQSDQYDWRDSVFNAARALKTSCNNMFILGASFGGALAIDYAVHADRIVSGLILINTPLGYQKIGSRPTILKILRIFMSHLPKFGLSSKEKDRHAKLGSAASWPISGLLTTQNFIRTFVKPVLPRVRLPVLIMKNDGDPYVPSASSVAIYHAINSVDKELVTIPTNTHRPFRDRVTVDFMVSRVDSFIKRALASTTKL